MLDHLGLCDGPCSTVGIVFFGILAIYLAGVAITLVIAVVGLTRDGSELAEIIIGGWVVAVHWPWLLWEEVLEPLWRNLRECCKERRQAKSCQG